MTDFQKQVSIILIALIWYSSLLFVVRYFTPQPVPIIITNTGTTIIQTGSVVIPTDTWSFINTWSFTRADYLKALTGTWLETIEAKVNYVLSFGEKGNDFVTVTPQPQNIVLWATKSSNNILIQSFIQKYQYGFNLDKNRTGYFVVKTQKRVPDSKDMLLGINGMSMGSLHKNIESNKFKSDVSDNYLDTLYIFPIDNIKVAQVQLPLNLTTFNPLSLTVVIGENNNSVVSLSIVYIN